MGSKREVIWFKNSSNLNEIYQSFDMKFSFANVDGSGKLVQCHEWVKCRDYLHDAVRTQLTGVESRVYGFTFSTSKNPELCLSRTMMLVTNKSIEDPKDFRRKLNKGLKLLHHYENMMGESLSKVCKVAGDTEKGYKHVWLVTSSKFWLTTPYLVSLFTLLLRCGMGDFDLRKHKKVEKALKAAAQNSKLGNNDNVYLSQIADKIGTVMEKYGELCKPMDNGFSKVYYDNHMIDTFHNRSGILSVCTCNSAFPEINTVLREQFEE
jgi:hypothetical protein